MPADRDAALDPDRIRATGFSTAFRGYDQHEVRRYLERLAEALRARGRPGAGDGPAAPPARAQQRATELEVRLAEREAEVSGLEATIAGLRRDLAAREAELADTPQLDDERAAQLLGREAARVLEAARRAAAELARTAQADVDSLRATARSEAERIVAEARHEAERIRREAAAEHDAAVAEMERRRAGEEERLGRLRTSTDELASALRTVRDQVDRAIGGLDRPGPAPPLPDGHDDEAGGPRDSDADGREAARDHGPAQVATPRLAPEEAAALDAVFAKVRADRSPAVAEGRQGLGQQGRAGAEPAPVVGAADASGPADAATPPPVPADAPVPGPAPRPATPSRDEAPFTARDEALAALEGDLLRQLKRAMADAQSELLDVVGRSHGGLTVGDLPDVAAQRGRYRAAATEAVGAAFRAGAAAGGGAVDDGACAELRSDLATRVADLLHQRVAHTVEATGGEPEAALDRIRAHYREFRAGVLGPLVADALAEAYAVGSYRSHPAGTRLVWTPDPRTPAGPDCADNAMAGTVPVPEPFPTGHRCPPAGPGCRCLALPA